MLGYYNFTSPAFAIIAIIIWVTALLIWYFSRKKRDNLKHLFLVFLYGIFFILVMAITVFPLCIGLEQGNCSINLVPIYYLVGGFVTNVEYRSLFIAIRQIVISVGANIIMFIPLGILSGLLFKKFQRFGCALLLGVLVSLSIEIIQLIGSYIGIMEIRIFDVNDIIFNALGCIIGYFILKRALKSEWGKRFYSSIQL
ncbi:VanZ family protein [Christensenellaceae bacterium OttesenSCG-928-K19]|nr:VanZ family protein [Christensenellaceae bacterium OttesenSCG-928-K19]